MIVFRVDGNSHLGAGHIMRCLAIANTAKEMNEECLFVLASGDFEKVVLDNKHRTIVLNSDYSIMNTEELVTIIDLNKPRAVFIDSYFVTKEYMSNIHYCCKNIGASLIYIDDRCKIPFSCDYLINYNISADIDEYSMVYCGEDLPEFLLGTLYTPLRKEFQNQDRRKISTQSHNILVSTGGADPFHFTLELVEAVKSNCNYTFHFVVGFMNLDKKKIREVASENSNIVIHENVTEMGMLMRSCDVAISAAGSTLYELCATQTPTVTYIIADNQIPLANVFDMKGIIQNSGDIRVLGNNELARTLISNALELAENYDERIRIANEMSVVVDGCGTQRIMELLKH